MLPISWILVSTVYVAAVYGTPQTNVDDWSRPPKGIWAVLVAGSHTWVRYRHQSNVCHAYKILRENGIPKNRIITFMYDDIAYNEKNPEKGVIRNEPGGENVYDGVPIDYSGDNVNKDVFLKVLQGYSTKLNGTGSGRVVASNHHENIFIFHTGLGGHNGYITYPDSNDSELYAPTLSLTFEQMYNRKAYKNILMVLESSHSGAMFENNVLHNNIKVMAITASGPDEDTWGTWCDTGMPCLAGLFSYAWLNNTKNTLPSTSLFNHYDVIRNSVANTGKEHPQIYGDWSVGKLPLSDFIGRTTQNNSQSLSVKNIERLQYTAPWDTSYNDEFDKDSLFLKNKMVQKAVTTDKKKNDSRNKLKKIVQLVQPIPSENLTKKVL